jgi:Ca2+-binding RTX toxin-like protein
VSEHMPWLYQAEIKFVSELGYDLDELAGYSRVALGATATGLFSYGIGISNDNLTGSSGRDLILGGRGSDRMQGLGGKDRIDGGSGSHDAAVYTEKTAGIEVALDGDSWIDVRVGSKTEDIIRNVEDIAGGNGDDAITGDGKGNHLAGNNGDDSIDGGGARDILWGGLGRDTLTGGSSADQFVFDVKPRAADADLVTDFTSGEDRIALDNAIFKALGKVFNKSEFFAADGARDAHDKSDHIIYDTRSGRLFYDEDAKKHGEGPHLIAVFEDKPAISWHDFQIV